MNVYLVNTLGSWLHITFCVCVYIPGFSGDAVINRYTHPTSITIDILQCCADSDLFMWVAKPVNTQKRYADFISHTPVLHPTYVATTGDNETRALKITRKQSTFGGGCQPANDLCPIVAPVCLSTCQSAMRCGVLLRSRGAACGLIGVAWSCSTWKKSQCHLVTLGHAAKLLAGGWSGHVAEEGCVLSTVVMNHCAAPPPTPSIPLPPVCPTAHPTSPHH